MKVSKEIRDFFINTLESRKIFLEGNILKIIEADEGDEDFSDYLEEAITKDKDSRRRRLEIMKRVQEQNRELLASENENKRLMTDLKNALQKAEDSKNEAIIAKELAEVAKNSAVNDLDILQRRSQTELISTIVKVALFLIGGVGVITTIMYMICLFTGKDTQIISSTWSNMFGILLTNAFSIVGTIMGVKYASQNKSD